MNIKRLILFSSIAAGIALSGIIAAKYYFSWKTEKLTSACDLLTANPNDKTKPPNVRGVDYNAIDFEHAIPTCYEATVDQPQNARLKFQYGRALDAGKQGSRAIAAYQEAFDLGFALAANNLGSIYQEGRSGIPVNSSLALKWYEMAADRGISFGKQGAAQILEQGEGLQTPDIARAAKYWRSLADDGDAEASEKVGLAIQNKSISALSDRESMQRLRMAADKGRLRANMEYATILSKLEHSSDNLKAGARYSLSAYKIAATAAINTEEAWLPYQLDSFNLYRKFIDWGAANEMPLDEYKAAVADFPQKSVKFTVPIDCEGKKTDFDFYVWQWSRKYPQTDPQAEWLKQARSCTFPQEVVESFRRLLAIAIENNVNFPELTQYAMKPEAPKSEVPNTPAPQGAAATTLPPAPAPTANDQILRSMQEAESRRAAEERQRHEETLRAAKVAARQQCEAERTICNTQCAHFRGAIDSDPWYSLSPRTKCEVKCMLIKCD